MSAIIYIDEKLAHNPLRKSERQGMLIELLLLVYCMFVATL